MRTNESENRRRSDDFVRAIGLLSMLGTLWLVVVLAYAAWLGLLG
jgi:hypothetical protein